MTAPEITVTEQQDRRVVTMRSDAGDSIGCYVFADGTLRMLLVGYMKAETVDLRRLADAIDAVRAGTWQPTPALPTGGAA